jgi:hypothetical protein
MRRTISARKLAVLLVLGFALVTHAARADATAFHLVREGSRYVGEQSKNKVVRVASEKSIGTLTPNIWVIAYFDPIANQRSSEVKFGAGKMMTVKKPFRPLDFVLGKGSTMLLEELKVDSDAAIRTALDQPLLENIKVTSTQLDLKRVGRGSGEPVWTVSLWATRVSNTAKDAKVGEVKISALDGRVIESDLKPSRLD